MRRRHPFPTLLSVLLAATLACAEPPSPSSASTAATPNGVTRTAQTDADALRRTARLLAGLPTEGAAEADAAVWQRHAAEMEAAWAALEARHLGPMRGWAASTLDVGAPQARLFYPFGGPDLLSAVQLFPTARSYVLVGLEPPGKIPDLAGLAVDDLAAELERLRGGLANLVASGYFVTRQMEEDFAPSTTRLDGFLPVLYLSLARSGQRPTAVRYVTFDDSGEVAAAEAATDAVEITFASDGAGAASTELRTVYYVAQDLSDAGLAGAPAFTRFLRRGERWNVFMKSASYLLHMPGFTTARDLLLERARTVLQDDSGLPLRAFDPATWELRFFGVYAGTLPAYREWQQEDLRQVYAARPDTPPLPFAVGYNSQIAGSCLIWAERRGGG